jgi:hypothetical protein
MIFPRAPELLGSCNLQGTSTTSPSRVNKYLFDLAHVQIKSFRRSLLFHPLAGHGFCPPCPLYNCYLLVIPRIFGVLSVNHYHLMFELVLVYFWMALLLYCHLLYQMCQRVELQLENQISDQFYQSQRRQFNCLFF